MVGRVLFVRYTVDLSPGCRAPHANGFVFAAGDVVTSVREECNAPNRHEEVMAAQSFLGFHVPPTDVPIRAPGNELLTVRGKGELIGNVVARQGA